MGGYFFVKNHIRDLYLNIIFNTYLKENLDICNQKILIIILKKCQIDPDNFLKDIKDPKIKERLKSIIKDAHYREIFGTPTFLVNNKIFQGQDRLKYALDKYNNQLNYFKVTLTY